MIKIKKKVIFKKKDNRMKSVSSTSEARKIFFNSKSKNLNFLLHHRYSWMNNFISENDKGIDLGSGAGFSKFYIKNKNFKLTDLSADEHIDIKNVDAQNTNFENNSFDYIISTNMIHHLAFPIKYFKEMNRILKKNGKLIIFEPYCSIIFQLVEILMRHEGFNFEVDVWDEEKPISNQDDLWDGNLAVSNLIFDDKEKFKDKLGHFFSIKHEKLVECLIFLNSGGVTSKTLHLPMNNFFLRIIYNIDKILVKLMPNIFCMGRQIVLEKK
tara:strand:+ start:1830 stop:2636 length:807 start_codon:yes stop_codon:yes gene_type:complete